MCLARTMHMYVCMTRLTQRECPAKYLSEVLKRHYDKQQGALAPHLPSVTLVAE